MHRRALWAIVTVLIAVQMILAALVVHRESLTFDEANHMFAGFMMWHAGDYGLNPEHPPLVKLLSALPLLGHPLWVPQLKGRTFKTEAYVSGREWVARNDGDRNQIVFRMRLAVGLLAVSLSLMIFQVAREYFGDWAALAALTLTVFDPSVLAHSDLVTTDIGVSLLLLASTWCFYRYVRDPIWTRLVVAGVVAGLLFATKHSGILLAPILLLLICREIIAADKGARANTAMHLGGATLAIGVIGVVVLWGFYGFRFAARPSSLKMSVSVAEYVAPLSPQLAAIAKGLAHVRALPESYLIGLVDVARMAASYPTFLFGKNYAHGVWWYFPSVIAIKTTLGLLGLTALAVFAISSRRFRWGREAAFVVIPAVFYLFVAMVSGMNIGVRHLLPFYALLFVLIGGVIAALSALSRRGLIVSMLLVGAHVVSSVVAFPNYIAYANEAWGGPANVHNLLSDANVDWAQQLFQVKEWQDRHPAEECWFAYFAYPEIHPETYGIRCHHLPTVDTYWLGGADDIPPIIDGVVIISAGDLSGCEWPAASLNPYFAFQKLHPSETIDYSVMIYRGHFDMHQAAALARAENSQQALWKGDFAAALSLAQEATALDSSLVMGHVALGDAFAAQGRSNAARAEWRIAWSLTRELDAAAQLMLFPTLQSKAKM